jgi:hypothetical protein
MIHERIDESDPARGKGSESHVFKVLFDNVHKEAGEDVCGLRQTDSFSFNTVILQVDHLRNRTKNQGSIRKLVLSLSRPRFRRPLTSA